MMISCRQLNEGAESGSTRLISKRVPGHSRNVCALRQQDGSGRGKHLTLLMLSDCNVNIQIGFVPLKWVQPLKETRVQDRKPRDGYFFDLLRKANR